MAIYSPSSRRFSVYLEFTRSCVRHTTFNTLLRSRLQSCQEQSHLQTCEPASRQLQQEPSVKKTKKTKMRHAGDASQENLSSGESSSLSKDLLTGSPKEDLRSLLQLLNSTWWKLGRSNADFTLQSLEISHVPVMSWSAAAISDGHHFY